MNIKLISFNLCPFVHRAIIMLNEKKIHYDIEYIDLKNKPDWFLQISPLGKVPVMLVDEKPLFESIAILEFLDDSFKPRLHPDDLFLRARHRALFSVVDNLFTQSYMISQADTNEKVELVMQNIDSGLSILEKEVQLPMFNGEQCCLIDVGIAPFFYRMKILEPHLPEIFKGHNKIHQWSKSLLKKPEVSNGLVENFKELYIDYFKGSISIVIN